MTVPDPRWDEATEWRMVPVVCSELCQNPAAHATEIRALLGKLADAGLLLTPQMAEVLEAAKRVVAQDRAAPADGITSEWEGGYVELLRGLCAAVDAWEASREH